jgi:hypothetical protein
MKAAIFDFHKQKRRPKGDQAFVIKTNFLVAGW